VRPPGLLTAAGGEDLLRVTASDPAILPASAIAALMPFATRSAVVSLTGIG